MGETRAGVRRRPCVWWTFLGWIVALIWSLTGQEDLRNLPLEVRRAALDNLVAGIDGLMFSEAIDAEGAVVFAKACEMGLEGIVSKRLGSRLLVGPGVKNPAFERT